MDTLTPTQQATYLAHLKAFLHAEVDGQIALVEAKRKDDGRAVSVACIVEYVQVPPRVLGGEATTAQKLVPIFEFVDPTLPNPYDPRDTDLVVEPPKSSVIVLPANDSTAAAA